MFGEKFLIGDRLLRGTFRLMIRDGGGGNAKIQ